MFRYTVLALSFSVCIASAQTVNRPDGKKLSGAEAASIAQDELSRNHVMGAEIAVLHSGRLQWKYAYGLRDAAQKLPMQTDTNTWAASITKAVFASWVMQQVHAGKLNLDEPIAKMLPKPLNEYDRYGEAASELVKDPNWQLVTPRMMLSHSSGLANFWQIEPDKKMRLHFRPGSRMAYSGEGLNILQFVMEQRSGVSLDAAMQQDIFGPLGMQNTGMIWRKEFAANTALRYDARDKLIGRTQRFPARAAGSMASTAEDLSKYLEAFLAGKVVDRKAMDEMLKPQVRIDQKQQFPTFTEEKSGEGPHFGLAYGLGWGVLQKTPFGPAFFKEGHGDGAENFLICYRKGGDCMMILTNSDNGELAFRGLLERIFGVRELPWTWESYTREQILANEEHAAH